MTADELHRLLIAPELIVLNLALATLRALRLALLVEHPTIETRHSTDEHLIQTRARAVLRSARQLQRALERYRETANEIISTACDCEDDIPF